LYDSIDVARKLPFGLLVVNIKGEVVFVNECCQGFLKLDFAKRILIQDILPGSPVIKSIKEGKFEISNGLFNEQLYMMNVPLVEKELGASSSFQKT
jgi:hypothetical protein